MTLLCNTQGAVNRQLLDQRALFVRASAPEASAVTALHTLTLRSTRHDTGAAVSQRFLVGQCRAGGRAADLAKHAGELFGVPLIPWCARCGFEVGVAVHPNQWCCCQSASGC